MTRRAPALLSILVVLLAVGCAEEIPPGDDLGQTDGTNPFLSDYTGGGKEDTGYVNPDGVEVEVTLEGEVSAPSYRIYDAPAELGQYAMTYLRKRGHFYLESLAEDATSDQRVEWRVDEVWVSATEARQLPTAQLTHFRIRGVNAVLLHTVADGVSEGQVFTATVPVNPYTAYTEGGEACVDPDSHLGMSSSIYWYLWNPDKPSCAVATQELQVTVTALLPPHQTTYPEYDQLIADGRLTSVVLFGRISDPPLTDSDPGVRNLNQMARWLLQAGFAEANSAPVGRRFSKTVAGIEIEVDLYSPYDFAGLSDMGNYANFERAITEHEIVVYDGHSMLGASDFWSRPDYPDFYQIYLYGGCLGYEYYVRPILGGKDGWAHVDIVSSVVEVSASANYYFAPFLAKVMWALENDYAASWTDLIAVIRGRVGDSTFGVSGARDNCFSPAGSLCGGGGGTEPEGHRFESTTAMDIPDDDDQGIASSLTVDEGLDTDSIELVLDLTHSWVGDLYITLEHAGQVAIIWNHAGGSDADIHRTFTLDGFAGLASAGEWTLRIKDTEGYDTGRLTSWALVF